MKELQQRITDSLLNNTPFAIFRKPNTTIGKAIFQKNKSTYFTSDYSENGFVFAPFNSDEKTLLIPTKVSEELFFNADFHSITTKNQDLITEVDKEFHVNLVQKGIDFINNSDTDKIVLSRKEIVEVDDFDCFETLQNLMANYPNAYVYLWFHPVSGLWMGATPEVLVLAKNQEFTIMALASTQEYNGSLDIVWNKKERQEHQFVIDYIVSQLSGYQLKVSETTTVRAGNLVHLKADILGEFKQKDIQFLKLIKALHPTSATCGLPRETAKEFILQNENYNREYYTGFLGEISDTNAEFYVNLRCMKVEIENQKISLYIGGGITKDSNPQHEWQETIAKSNVMKKVL